MKPMWENTILAEITVWSKDKALGYSEMRVANPVTLPTAVKNKRRTL